VEELTGTRLEWSTIVEEHAKIKERKEKTCLLCGKSFAGGPNTIRMHLDIRLKRDVGVCKPKPQFKARHALVVAELRRRAAVLHRSKRLGKANAEQKEEGRAVAQGLSVEQVRAKAMFNVKTPDDVTEAWVRLCVKKAMPLDIFDDPCFREAIVLTVKCGGKLMGAHQEVLIPKRKKITDKILPKVDKELDEKIKGRMQAVLELTGATIISDGWSSCANRPILNALAASPLGTYFIKADDTSGHTKDAGYVAKFTNKVIDDFGPSNVTAVCMDGACKSSFTEIEEEHEHVFCYICPTHSLDNFMKNVCSGEKETINVRGYEGPTLQWGEKLFCDSFDKVT
jgi:hypothetical protein